MSAGKHIRVDASMAVAHDPDYEFTYIDDHEEFGAGQCAEGHPIRYGYVFENSSGDKVELGGECQWKVYLFRKWQNLQPQQITPTLLKIGEKFWNFDKDGLWTEAEELLKQQNMKVDFDTLPLPEDQERYLKFIRDLLSESIKLRKARAKEAEKQRALDAKLAYLKDPTYLALKNRTPFNDEDTERLRSSLLSWYERKASWTSKQEDLVKKLILRVEGPKSPVDEHLKDTLDIIKKLESEETNNAKNFLGDLLKYKTVQRSALTIKQANWLIILYQKHASKIGNPGFDFSDYIKTKQRKE